MRRQIAWLTAATTSAVVLAFVIPLCLLVRTLAEDRALANADQEARNVAILVSNLSEDPSLPRLVARVDQRSPRARTSVLSPDGTVLGAADPAMADDPEVVRAGQGEAFTVLDDAGARILVPVVVARGTTVIRTTVPRSVLREGVARAWASIIGLGAVLLLAAVLVAMRLGRRISTPVADLAQVAHRLREGDLHARALPAGPTETVELGVALNRLAERITELLEAERAAVGDLAHRLRTPVTALRLDVESAGDTTLAGRLAEHVAALQRTVDAIVNDARRPVRSAMSSSCDATRVVGDRVAYWRVLAEDQGRALTSRLPSTPLVVGADPEDLRDVVDVLLDNVFAHTPEGTGFSVRLERAGGRGRLEVRDEGPAVPARHPGDRVGTTGLGLQIVRRTITALGGEVEIEQGTSAGFAVTVTLPLAAGPRDL
ncbi:MAG TPA: HAMP domain-containing sensor histidine kinase [Nocardioides sp.]|nr:HAMP domain-containing sensor histidine kinase [Nocardioides sp.]